MPFKSEKQKKYLYANEPEVAEKFSEYDEKENMSARIEDNNGWVEIKNNPISKVGVFPYLGKSIGLPGLDPNKFYDVYRPAEELSSNECIESFKLVPWIDEHEMLGKKFENAAEKKGIEGVIGEEVYFDYPYLKANIKIFSDSLDESIENGKKELSCGYACIYEKKSGVFENKSYDIVQKIIRGNHLALVNEGRMGYEVAVLDKKDKLTFSIDSREIAMADKKEETKSEDEEKSLENLYKTIADMKKSIDACMKDVSDIKKSSVEDMEENKKVEDMEKEKKSEDMEKETKIENKGQDFSEISNMKKIIENQSQEIEKLKSAMDQSPSTEDVINDMRSRDDLIQRLSQVVGVFDHSELKSQQQVAKYGVDHLGIECPEGTEIIAINAYMKANPSPNIAIVSAEDKSISDGINEYING